MKGGYALFRFKILQFLIGACILVLPSMASAFTYYYTAHDFGPDLYGHQWNIWDTHDSIIWDWNVDEVNGYEHIRFKTLPYSATCAGDCVVHAVVTHDPTTGFNPSSGAGELVAVNSFEFPQSSTTQHIYRVDYQWHSAGYDITVYDQTTSATTSTSTVAITPTADMVDMFGSRWNWSPLYSYNGESDTIFPFSYSPSVILAATTSVDGGGPEMQTTPHYVITGSSTKKIHTITNNINSDATFYAGEIYKIFGDISIASGHSLTIQPGAIVKFDTAASSSITVNGTLTALATTSDTSIFFTSLKDDIIGGDTNGDGTATSFAPGDWGGIVVNSGGRADISRAVIRYGGKSIPMLYNNGGILNISTSTIVFSAKYGIKNSAGSTTISGSDVGFNEDGLYVDGGNAVVYATSTLHDNTAYSIYNDTSNMIFAKNNWWSATTGPYNASSNPIGTTTSAVSAYVDFDPWVGSTTHPMPTHYLVSDTAVGCGIIDACWSVASNTRKLLIATSSVTVYTSELNSAILSSTLGS